MDPENGKTIIVITFLALGTLIGILAVHYKNTKK